jgi:hypothetical protein
LFVLFGPSIISSNPRGEGATSRKEEEEEEEERRRRRRRRKKKKKKKQSMVEQVDAKLVALLT